MQLPIVAYVTITPHEKGVKVTSQRKSPRYKTGGEVNREASRLGDAGAKDPFPATGAGTLAAEPP
jgi:hypothetical protein